MSQSRKRELESKLTLEQRKACLLIVDNELGDVQDKTRKKKTLQEIADEVGVSRQTLYTWRQDPAFVELKNIYAYDALSNYQPQVFNSLLKMIFNPQGASIKAIDLFARIQGLLKERQVIEHVDANANRSTENIEKEIEDIDAKLKEAGIADEEDLG